MIPRALLGIILLLGAAAVTNAQPDSLWSQIYGGPGNDRFYTIQQTADGGFIAGGVTTSSGAGLEDAWIVKTDVNGNELWSQTFGTPWPERCSSICQTAEGYVIGVYAWDFWLIFTDENGGLLHSSTFGGEEREWCEVMIPTNDGGYLMAGESDAIEEGNFEFYVIKTDADGDSLWSNTFGRPWTDYCYTVAQTDDGGYMLGGYTRFSSPGSQYFWLIRLNAEGDSLWSRTYSEGVDAVCYDLKHTADGGFIAAGTTGEWAERDFYVVKIDAEGNEVWSRTFGAAGCDVCQSVLETPDGGYLLAGYRYRVSPPGSGYGDVWLIRLDSGGDSLWSKAYGDSIGEYCNTIQSTADGLIIAGEIYPIEDAEGFLMKLGPDSIGPVPPGSFMRVLPEDSSYAGWDEQYVEMSWTRSIDPNGEDIVYILHVASPTFDWIPMPIDTVLSDTFFIFDAPFVEQPNMPLDEIYEFHWTVHATDNIDTVEASNGEGYFLLDRTGTVEKSLGVPTEYSLSAYPNPFNPTTTISFTLPETQHVSLSVYDIIGRQLDVLAEGIHNAGEYRITYDASGLSSGIYFVQFKGSTFRTTQKLILIR